jgi:hypothetical protein
MTANDSHGIHDAINRSVHYGEIVTVALANGVNVDKALIWVAQRSESHQHTAIDRNEAGARREDVWGDDGKGGEFRLLLVEGEA